MEKNIAMPILKKNAPALGNTEKLTKNKRKNTRRVTSPRIQNYGTHGTPPVALKR